MIPQFLFTLNVVMKIPIYEYIDIYNLHSSRERKMVEDRPSPLQMDEIQS